jgi:hypothetical protein
VRCRNSLPGAPVYPKPQVAIASHLIAAGQGYLRSNGLNDVIATLKSWGVLQPGIPCSDDPCGTKSQNIGTQQQDLGWDAQVAITSLGILTAWPF